MLKALELVGFKSFADKSRFEFPAGITAVVGPNGSGKSNVVDAIKWVLGEQSVRSLRGKEMADCIFNGSASRPPLNAAECTLTLDNTARALAVDADEVHITRRVYRNGDGEYLINRQPSRLRDIRELLAGSGMGVEAYAIIEQGKVDVLLQSSPRDRRVVFEEAAGIGRFKMKKVETLRRLERVEQNLLRLSDIVDEVDGRLRSVRAQASKARRYKEHADRLQNLRTQVAQADWRTLGEKLLALETEISRLTDDQAGASAAAESHEAHALELETTLGDTLEAIRACEAAAAARRERIAAADAAIEHETARVRDLEEELGRRLAGIRALGVRAGDLDSQLRDAAASIAETESQCEGHRQATAEHEERLARAVAALDELRLRHGTIQKSYVESAKTAGALTADTRAWAAQLEAAENVHEQLRRRWGEAHVVQTTVENELVSLEEEHARRQVESQRADARLATTRASLAEGQRDHALRLRDLHELEQRRSGIRERAALLEELESRFDGLGAGVKTVLVRSREQPAGPLRHVLGLAADLLQADIEMAPLIDLALGERAQHLVVEPGADLLPFLRDPTPPLAGRAAFLRLDFLPPPAEDAAFDGRPGVVGRADRFVQTRPELRPLAAHLLGGCWIVENLARALDLAAAKPPCDFLTLAGEYLAADGTLTIGPKQASTGLVSRRSELRDLARRLSELTERIDAAASEVGRLADRVASDESSLAQAGDEQSQAATALTEQRMRLQAATTRQAQGAEELRALSDGLAAAAARRDSAASALLVSETRREHAASELEGLEAQLADVAALLAEAANVREDRFGAAAVARVELARLEQHAQNSLARLQQLERDQDERRRALQEGRSLWLACRDRLATSQMAILGAESRLSELYLDQEKLAGDARRLHSVRDAQRQRRAELLGESQIRRVEARRAEQRLHAQQLAASEVRHERSALAERVREDYNLELAQLAHQAAEGDPAERQAVEEEIANLRRKLANLGNVNLDALAELDELESRHERLSTQHRDLTEAKDALVRVIHKIDADSRRLFAETLEAVKANFQALFRKLFAGGQADIVLEEGVDILDSGIEIVARPPGKEPRSISLLSGGEKTLTCVALLMAIFQYRPSTFCVLDEVDASLDEANIERFIGVLQEFLAWTQFIVVTHSKKTMTCASTLHGVTMQESGVSKRVSVRFEDVSDDGRLRVGAEANAGSSQADDDTQAA